VGSLTNWKQVTQGTNASHTGAVKTDGTLWIWGFNNLGQLGLGDSDNRSSPVQVGSLTNWKQTSIGSNHTSCIKTDGTLWGWGFNVYGQLGLGDSNSPNSPVQVGTLTDWKQVSAYFGTNICISSDDLPV
jgi:alpha-tubulin suppressor-like RCC1 family protein